MITAAILMQMANDIPELTLNKNAFWEELPLQKEGNPAQGVWLLTRGGSQTNAKQINNNSVMDFYVAFEDKSETEFMLKRIADWIAGHLYICQLDGNVGDNRYAFSNIRIRPTTTPTNEGVTRNGLIVKIASAQVYYDNNY